MLAANGILTSRNRRLTSTDLREWTALEDRRRYVDDSVAISFRGDGHRREPPRTTDGDVFCWVLGDVYGFDRSALEGSGTYTPKPDGVGDGSYCLRLFERYGTEFVRGLNGNFTLLLYDRESRTLSLITDRLGTVPVYYARPDDDTLVFSTSIQDIPQHPSVETTFHPQYLHEYLAFRHTFGVKTPLTGIETLQPGSVTTFDLGDGSVSTTEHWRPVYEPRDVPFERFVEEFTRTFRRVLAEWTTPGERNGVLLSGGSDSRLVLGGLDDATAFHMNDWMNREAKTAERVAVAADAEFVPLRRDASYRVEALERNAELMNFVGWFTQAYTTGFESAITDRVDTLLTGLYGDTLFKRFSVPSREVSLGPVGSMTLPVERRVETVDDYVDLLLEEAHDNLDLDTDLRATLEANIYRTDDGIVHHGVTYDSLEELVYYGSCYPLSNDNDTLFYSALRRALPSRTPFLDNRLVDLSLSMPIRYRLRRNVIDRALAELAPELAEIPHAGTGVAPERPFSAKYLGEHVNAFRRKYVGEEQPPEPYMTHGPWPDDAELLRRDDRFRDVIEERAATADALPGIDAEMVREQMRAHRDGDDRLVELYTLLTVLEMPVTECVLHDDVPENDPWTIPATGGGGEGVNDYV